MPQRFRLDEMPKEMSVCAGAQKVNRFDQDGNRFQSYFLLINWQNSVFTALFE
jgi:hypothetical protein